MQNVAIKTLRNYFFAAALALCIAPTLRPHLGSAQAEDQAVGSVRISVEEYNRLLAASQAPDSGPSSTRYAFTAAQAQVNVELLNQKRSASALVSLQFSLQVFSSAEVFVPLLPASVAVESFTLSGSAYQLQQQGNMLGLRRKGEATDSVELKYRLPVLRSQGASSFQLLLPSLPGTTLRLQLPAKIRSVDIFPSNKTLIESAGSTSSVSAVLPLAPSVQVSWRTEDDGAFSLSRASYKGTELQRKAVRWSAEFQVDLSSDEQVEVPFLPKGLTLSALKVDDKDAPILAADDSFRTVISGRGSHRIATEFITPIISENGPMRIEFPLIPVPISRFELHLKGKKEVEFTPASSTQNQTESSDTVAIAYVPMSSTVRLQWNEALPDEIKAELRAATSVYHLISAEEKLLSAQAIVQYEITRGETSTLEFEIPKEVDISSVSSPMGGVADWRLIKQEAKTNNLLQVYLDRSIKTNYLLEVHFDRSLPADALSKAFSVPLLTPLQAHRQRGMIALLSGKELALRPTEQDELVAVGENQLPSDIRERSKLSVSHTFKYADTQPTLAALLTAPEKKPARFDGYINSLISLSDVMLRGAATIELNIKSGGVPDLSIEIPEKVNLLSLTAPSLRNYKVEQVDSKQVAKVQFTQDMEGQLRIEATYELITDQKQTELRVPTLRLQGAEVEQGRIAVEALSAVEVQPSTVEGLSKLDHSELPQQLILKTTNPILLAYKYVRADPGYSLSVKLTRHKELDVQSASIDLAEYTTLYTVDGVAVTSAEFMVRNSQRQFLKVHLPKAARIWAVKVNGSPEKPALAEAAANQESQEVLIKIISSAQSFPVQLLFQVQAQELGQVGNLRLSLPKPDMLATKTVWNLFVPAERRYGEPDSNMRLLRQGYGNSTALLNKQMAVLNSQADAAQMMGSDIPTQGIAFGFEKLYANEASEDTYVSLPYMSTPGYRGLYFIAILAVGAFWLALGCLALKLNLLNSRQAAGGLLGAALLAFWCIQRLGTAAWPLTLGTLAGIGVVAWLLRQARPARATVAEEQLTE
jgi:hypothetical protein